MANVTYGRTVVISATNKSGGGLIAGDVVVVDTTNNLAFTTDTSGGFVGTVGIAQGTIANNAAGLFAISGYVALVNTNASVTRGHYGKTYTVAKQATDAGASRGVGTFCEFTTGGTTPDAIMWPVDLLGSSLTNPMTTKGDIILGDTGGTPTRLAAGTANYVLTAQGAGAFETWTTLKHGFQAYNSNVQAVNSATAALTLDSEVYDTDAYHSTGSATSRGTIPAGLGGLYVCTANSFANTSGLSWFGFRVNGADVKGSGKVTYSPLSGGYIGASAQFLLVPTDYVEAFCFTTGSVNVGHASAVDAQTTFTMTLISLT